MKMMVEYKFDTSHNKSSFKQIKQISMQIKYAVLQWSQNKLDEAIEATEETSEYALASVMNIYN